MEYDWKTLPHQHVTLEKAVGDMRCTHGSEFSVIEPLVGKLQDVPVRSVIINEFDNADQGFSTFSSMNQPPDIRDTGPISQVIDLSIHKSIDVTFFQSQCLRNWRPDVRTQLLGIPCEYHIGRIVRQGFDRYLTIISLNLVTDDKIYTPWFPVR